MNKILMTILFSFSLYFAVSKLNAQNILVTNYKDLTSAIYNVTPGNTILMANGMYDIEAWGVEIPVPNITIRSQSRRRRLH